MIFKNKNIDDFNLQTDIQVIESILDISDVYLAFQTGLSRNDIVEWVQGNKLTADKEELESIYNYAFNQNLYLNDIKWQMYKDQYQVNNTLVLCHGSRTKIIGNLRLDASGDSNDFANGFYCGENTKQAGMFVSEELDSSLYILTLNLNGLNVVKFNTDTDWLLAVSYYRDTLGYYANNQRVQSIIKQCNNADVIIAPIADNRMFELIDQFLAGELTDKQCLYAMSATQLGYQYVCKTQKALDNIELLERCYLCASEKAFYNKSNVRESNTGLNKAQLAKRLYSNEGKYIKEIL